jgi:3D (Asp-Asp-Asp) domain-containing protein
MPRLGLRLAVAGVAAAPLALAVLVAGLGGTSAGCANSAAGGSWLATAYGPPWEDGNGSGITATGLNLTAGPPLLEVAVDPSVIALGSYVYVQPNPFHTTDAFYAGDTGSAILGQHVDIYDWQGRASQQAWGTRTVTVTPAPNGGAGNLLGAVPTPTAESGGSTAGCLGGALGLTSGETSTIERDGSALAPSRLADASQAGNRRRQPDPHHPLPHARRPLRAAIAAVAGV